jgi:hypothetical protein
MLTPDQRLLSVDGREGLVWEKQPDDQWNPIARVPSDSRLGCVPCVDDRGWLWFAETADRELVVYALDLSRIPRGSAVDLLDLADGTANWHSARVKLDQSLPARAGTWCHINDQGRLEVLVAGESTSASVAVVEALQPIRFDTEAADE